MLKFSFTSLEIPPLPPAPMLTSPEHNRNRVPGEQLPANQDNENFALAIEAAFDGRWRVWISDTGYWWAARTRPLTARELTAGCLPFLRADDPDRLSTLIRAQEELHAPATLRQTTPPINRRDG